MKILIVCSISFYDKIDNNRKLLEVNNHKVYLPNGYDKTSADSLDEIPSTEYKNYI